MKNKNIGFILLLISICLILTIANLYLKLNVTPGWFSGNLERNHQLLLDFNYTNNEQSRLFQFLIPEFFVRMFNMSIANAYVLQRVIFTYFTFFLFFFFCKKWFTNTVSIYCIVLLGILTPLSFWGDLQESSSLMSLTFLGALWTIREKKDLLFLLILVLGSINNETMLFLPLVYFLVNYKSYKFIEFKNLILKTVLLAFPAYLVVGIIRYINIDRPHLGGAFHLFENIYNLHHPLLLYNVFWVLAFVYFKKKDKFLKRALISIPFFIIPHLITGVIFETRQMVPLAFIIIPASVLTLQELNSKYARKFKTSNH